MIALKTMADLDKGTIYFDVGSTVDNFGKSSFTALWWQENHHNGPSWRSQCFHASMTQYVADAKRRGLKVIASRELFTESLYAELRDDALRLERESRA